MNVSQQDTTSSNGLGGLSGSTFEDSHAKTTTSKRIGDMVRAKDGMSNSPLLTDAFHSELR